MKNASDYIREDGPGQRTITSLAYWLTAEGINPLTAKMVQKAIDADTDADFAEAFDGASKDEAREFLAKWELCFTPYWSGGEVAHVIGMSGAGRDPARVLRAITLAQQAGELPQAFTPRRGVEWAKARGYLINRDICELVGAQPGQYGHPHSALVESPPLPQVPSDGASEAAIPRSDVSAPAVTPTHKQRRHALDLNRERGARRRIIELWDAIEAEYGVAADAHQVLRVLKRDKGEDEPSLKTIQNRLSELRKEGLIP
jgi:hypothetical protein